MDGATAIITYYNWITGWWFGKCFFHILGIS
jgi:hypothetical protein